MKIENLAIVGATGLVGQKILEQLIINKVDFKTLDLYASNKNLKKQLSYNNKQYEILSIDTIDYKKYDLIFFATNEDVSKKNIPEALKQNCIVIDNSSYFRMKENVQLLLPCVNFSSYNREKLIANPNCVTAILCNVLKPLNDLCPIKKVIINSYQSVSGIGKDALLDLKEETLANINNSFYESTYNLAFNLKPQIGEILENGYSVEENKIINECQKILKQKIEIIPTCVRVPTLYCHGEVVYVEFCNEVNLNECIDKLKNFEDILISDNFISNASAYNKKEVYVTRIRQSTKTNLFFYIISDNLLKGAAYNAVSILQNLKRMG